MDENPFQSPQAGGPNEDLASGADPRQIGRARQVRVVAVLMIVQGALLAIAGVGAIVFTFFFTGTVVEQIQQQQQNNRNMQQIGPEAWHWIFLAIYGGIGAVILAVGGLNVWAGIRNYSFRSRTLGIIGLIGGLASLGTCYCLPFSLALLIYGLVIYLGEDAERAFRWRRTKSPF